MNSQQPERLRALWKSGRDKYLSFFAVLEEVRGEVGNEALPRWCGDNLCIGLSVIVKIRKLLLDTDAEIVKRNLTAAAAAEKAQTRKTRDDARKVREDAAQARQLEKQRRVKEVAEARTAAEHAKTEAERAGIETKKERARRKQTPPVQGERQKRLTANISDAELGDLAKRFKKADAMCQPAIERWVDGSVGKALILCAARDKFTADQQFAAWLNENDIRLGHQDRAALIGLGRLGELQLRRVLTATDSRSYRLIWEENKQPALKIVET